ncbi:MAG: NYN domain-containing protein [Nitrospinae bacterium]|nr:NYN domain-containing protein [Nitrospinota bacterium]
MKIIIDGYNFLMTSRRFKGDLNNTLEETRNSFIKNLFNYKRLKGHDITVVFDGWKGGHLYENRDIINGIKVIYSKIGEKADDVIKKMVENEEGFTVITSDRDVAAFASRQGAIVISSKDFGESLMMAEILILKNEKEEEDVEKDLSTKKKGNPRRLSKMERKRLQRLKKL